MSEAAIGLSRQLQGKGKATPGQGQAHGFLSTLGSPAGSTAQGRRLLDVVVCLSLFTVILKTELGIEGAVRVRPFMVRSFNAFLR